MVDRVPCHSGARTTNSWASRGSYRDSEPATRSHASWRLWQGGSARRAAPPAKISDQLTQARSCLESRRAAVSAIPEGRGERTARAAAARAEREVQVKQLVRQVTEDYLTTVLALGAGKHGFPPTPDVMTGFGRVEGRRQRGAVVKAGAPEAHVHVLAATCGSPLRRRAVAERVQRTHTFFRLCALQATRPSSPMVSVPPRLPACAGDSFGSGNRARRARLKTLG